MTCSAWFLQGKTGEGRCARSNDRGAAQNLPNFSTSKAKLSGDVPKHLMQARIGHAAWPLPSVTTPADAQVCTIHLDTGQPCLNLWAGEHHDDSDVRCQMAGAKRLPRLPEMMVGSRIDGRRPNLQGRPHQYAINSSICRGGKMSLGRCAVLPNPGCLTCPGPNPCQQQAACQPPKLSRSPRPL